MADTLTTHTHRINQHEPSYTILRVTPLTAGECIGYWDEKPAGTVFMAA